MDVHNIYNQIQVQLLMRQEEFEDIPEFEQVFRDEEVGSLVFLGEKVGIFVLWDWEVGI